MPGENAADRDNVHVIHEPLLDPREACAIHQTFSSAHLPQLWSLEDTASHLKHLGFPQEGIPFCAGLLVPVLWVQARERARALHGGL